jgi:hypothetical protein
MLLNLFSHLALLSPALGLGFSPQLSQGPQSQHPLEIDLGFPDEFLKFSVHELLRSPESFEYITGPLHLNAPRLVQLFNETSNGPRVITEGEKYLLRLEGVKFMDITEQPNLGRVNALRSGFAERKHISGEIELPTHISNVGFIQSMYDALNATQAKEDIKKLSSFWTRNYRSPWGLASSNWIYHTVSEVRWFPERCLISQLTPSCSSSSQITLTPSWFGHPYENSTTLSSRTALSPVWKPRLPPPPSSPSQCALSSSLHTKIL